MPSLKLVRPKKPVSYSIHPSLTHSLMPFPRRHGRQPLQNLPLLVRNRYLVVVPYIFITIRHITNVLVYINSRVLVGGPIIAVAGGGGSGDSGVIHRLKAAVTGDRGECFHACLSKGEGGRRFEKI